MFRATLLAVCGLLFTGSAAVAAEPVNVLFVVSDDLCNVLGCYGHPVVNPRRWDTDDEAKDLIFTLTPNAKGSARFGGTLSWHASDGPDAAHTDGMSAAETVKLLEANKDRPFFIACGFFRPHTPYVAP